MREPYPKEFRNDVVRGSRNRDDSIAIKRITEDFGISASCLDRLDEEGRCRGRQQARNDIGRER